MKRILRIAALVLVWGIVCIAGTLLMLHAVSSKQQGWLEVVVGNTTGTDIRIDNIRVDGADMLSRKVPPATLQSRHPDRVWRDGSSVGISFGILPDAKHVTIDYTVLATGAQQSAQVGFTRGKFKDCRLEIALRAAGAGAAPCAPIRPD